MTLLNFTSLQGGQTNYVSPSILLYGLGDSITQFGAGAQSPTGNEWGTRCWMTHTMGMSMGQLCWGKNAGVGGETTEQIVRRLNRDVLAEEPGICVVMMGTNGTGGSTLIADYTKAIDGLISKGFVAVICPIPPFGTSGGIADRLTDRTAIMNLVASYNRPDVIFADLFQTAGYLTGPLAGNWKDPLFTYDGTHPTSSGARALGTDIWNAINNSGVLHGLRNQRQADASDPANIISNSLFQSALVSGKPPGWSGLYGPLTCALVDPLPTETTKGKWLEITSPNGNGLSQIQGISYDMSPYYGQKMLVRFRYKTSGVTQANAGGFRLLAPGFNEVYQEAEIDLPESEFSTIFTAMPAAQSDTWLVQTLGNSSGNNNVKLYLAELTLIPLETSRFPTYQYLHQRQVTNGFTVRDNDRILLCDTWITNGSCTVPLPEVTPQNIGRPLTCIKIHAQNNMILDPYGSQKIWDTTGENVTRTYTTQHQVVNLVSAKFDDNLIWLVL